MIGDLIAPRRARARARARVPDLSGERQIDFIVTAKWQSECLKDVWTAISVLNGDSLEDRNIGCMKYMVGAAPSLSITDTTMAVDTVYALPSIWPA